MNSHGFSRLLTSFSLIVGMLQVPAPVNSLPMDAHMRCLKAPEWGKCVDDYWRPYKLAFVKCINERTAFNWKCQDIKEEMSMGMSNVAIDHFLHGLLMRAGVRSLNTAVLPDWVNPRLAPPHLSKECKTPGVQGFYSPQDKTIVYCNEADPGYAAWGHTVFAHEAVHAAQDCIGGGLKQIHALKEVFFKNTLAFSEQQVVNELYPPEQVELEIEAREFIGSRWDIAILLNYACSP